MLTDVQTPLPWDPLSFPESTHPSTPTLVRVPNPPQLQIRRWGSPEGAAGRDMFPSGSSSFEIRRRTMFR